MNSLQVIPIKTIVCLIVLVGMGGVVSGLGIPFEPNHTGVDYIFAGNYSDGQIRIIGTGDYYLTDNLSTTSSDYGIQIEGSNVILDGFGYGIFGSGNSGYGINVLISGSNGIIENFSSISNFYDGIRSEGDYVSIDNLEIHDNGVIGIRSLGNNAEIKQNIVYGHSDLGIYSYGSNSTVSENIVYYNRNGILNQGNYGTIYGNLAIYNTNRGLYAGGCYAGPEPGDEGYGYYANISENIVAYNDNGGICNWLPYATIQNNYAYYNNGSGIELSAVSNNTSLSGNHVLFNPIGIKTTDQAINQFILSNYLGLNDVSINIRSGNGRGNGFIYDNYLIEDDYVNGTGIIDNFLWTNPSGPSTGENVIGGPNIAGNYWSNEEGTGWSDLQKPELSGYSSTPLEIVSGSNVYDTAPLVRVGQFINATNDQWTINYPHGNLTYPRYSDVMYYTQGKPGALLNKVIIDGNPVTSDLKSNYIFENIQENHEIRTEGIPAPGQVHVQFSGTPRSGKAPVSVQFNDTSLGDPISWYWQFGDGFNSTIQNPVHIYTIPGIYSVSLRANNGKTGGSGFWTDYVRIS